MPTSELEVTVSDGGGAKILALHGDLDASGDGALTGAYAEATADEISAVVLDFAEAGYINSTGIAVIVGLLAQARTQGVTIAARGLSDHYREIFEITRLADFMTIEGGDG